MVLSPKSVIDLLKIDLDLKLHRPTMKEDLDMYESTYYTAIKFTVLIYRIVW